MPDWAQEIIEYVPRFVAVLSIYPASFKVFAWIEDRLSVRVKQEITAWLKSAGDFAARHTLSFSLLCFHNELFGDKQFSSKCIIRTISFSFASFILVFFPYIVEFLVFVPRIPISIINIKLHDNANTLFLEYLFVSFIFIVLPLDFFGIAVTRKLASLVGNNVTLKNGAFIFTFDTFIKAVIFPIYHLYFYFYLQIYLL